MPGKPTRGQRAAKNKSKPKKTAMTGGNGKKKGGKLAGAGAGFGSQKKSKRA